MSKPKDNAKKRNPVAWSLQNSMFKPRVVKDKTKYNRKKYKSYSVDGMKSGGKVYGMKHGGKCKGMGKATRGGKYTVS